MNTNTLTNHIERNCLRLHAFLSELSAPHASELKADLANASSARNAANRIDDLLSGDSPEVVKAVLKDSERRPPFLAAVSGSHFLHSILCRRPNLLRKMFLEKGYLIGKHGRSKRAELDLLTRDMQDVSTLNRALRMYKEEEYLRLGCRDLAGLIDVQELMGELSNLAEACIQVALEWHYGRLALKHGLPEGAASGMGFVVMGLGKMSGAELNFSSDVDLIFLRGPEEGLTDGPQPIPVIQFYESLARAVTSSLSDVTEDGFVFRVDLRLRPEGERGELVPSVANALDYYLGWGRTWERAALMKAAPVAGDLSLGRMFMNALEPFIYRKYLDYSTLEEMRDMKLRIQSKLRRKPGINIKLGQGGIREIEFFVQALQLINGGKMPQIRSRSTCESLDLFRHAGLLGEETTEQLRDAYLFFRKTEHRIQINHQLQTHELPKQATDQEELARRMGYKNNAIEAFLADLDKRRAHVEELFSSLFQSTSEDEAEQCSTVACRIVDGIQDKERSIELLSDLGFDHPQEAYPILRGLVVPGEMRGFPDKARSLLARLAPLFLDELLKTPEPAKALIALDRYVHSLHAGSTYLATLLENPATARFIVRILGESRFFTELLIRHPQAVDSLIGRWTVQHPREKGPLEEKLSERFSYYDDYETELDILRIFKNEQILRIGVSHLAGEIDSPTSRWLVTELAEVCLGAAVRIAAKEMARRFGDFDLGESLPFVILGMGKLGGREMTYLSDLDVIFVYDSPPEAIGRFSAHEWFTRLAARIISILSAPTAEGIAFEIDTRLRPSGQKGPLVSSLATFREYHRTTSQLWEKQALIKARPVAGPAFLAEDVADIVRNCVLRTTVSPDELAEIDRLRRRMEKEIAQEDSRHVDLKTGHGGLADVEFFVQANILLHARNRPEVLCHNTLEALAAMHKAGLLDSEPFRTLDSGYRFLTNLEDRLRIMEHRSVDRMPLEGEKLIGLARRLGYDQAAGDMLLEDYFRTTRSIRSIYDSFFQPGGDLA